MPRINTLAGEIFPAAVVIIGITFEVSNEALRTDAYPSRFACDERASIFCALEILGSLKKSYKCYILP